MADTEYNYNKVYVKNGCPNEECLREINPEVVYMTIPADWACIYQKLLVAIAQFGEQMLYDCQASCKNVNKNIVNCWHMFAAAIAAHQLGKDKLANTLIKYIDAQLKVIYRDSRCAEFDSMIPMPITEDGKLKALLGCENGVQFYVDLETGELYEKLLDKKAKEGTFTIEDNNLNYNG